MTALISISLLLVTFAGAAEMCAPVTQHSTPQSDVPSTVTITFHKLETSTTTKDEILNAIRTSHPDVHATGEPIDKKSIKVTLTAVSCVTAMKLAEEVLNAGTPVVLNAYAMLCDGEISTNIKP